MSFLQLRSLFQDPVRIQTNSTSGIGSTSATANGTLQSSHGSVAQELGFVYSLSPNPTTSDTKVTAAFTFGAYSASLGVLSAATTYHVRAYVILAGITYYGDDQQFTTSGAVASVTSSLLLMLGVA